MCYLVAKRFDGKGCLAMKVKHGKALADFTEALQKKIGDNAEISDIQMEVYV